MLAVVLPFPVHLLQLCGQLLQVLLRGVTGIRFALLILQLSQLSCQFIKALFLRVFGIDQILNLCAQLV